MSRHTRGAAKSCSGSRGTSKKPVYRQPSSRTALRRDGGEQPIARTGAQAVHLRAPDTEPSCIVAPAEQVIGQSPSGLLHIGDRKAHGS